jgi:hypothetical protein
VVIGVQSAALKSSMTFSVESFDRQRAAGGIGVDLSVSPKKISGLVS